MSHERGFSTIVKILRDSPVTIILVCLTFLSSQAFDPKGLVYELGACGVLPLPSTPERVLETHLEFCQSTSVGKYSRRICFTNSRVTVVFGVAGFPPDRRGPFVPAKGPKTIDAPSGSLEGTDARLRRADQLAPLTQGPPVEESVPPLGQTAGVGPWEPNISVTHMKEGGAMYFV